MKRYAKEIAALVLQAALFYLFPLCAGPTDVIGMVVLMLLATFALGLLLGALSDNAIKWACPAAAAVLFVPSVPIYYNATALVHATWYMVMGFAGMALGALIRMVVKKILSRK